MKALFVHGIGSPPADFADDAKRWLRSQAMARGQCVQLESIHWGPLADAPEGDFFREVGALGADGDPSQRLSAFTLADATMWLTDDKLQEDTFRLFDQTVSHTGKRITLFTHSLGALVATDWLRQRPEVQVERLVTMGCNLELFNLRRRFNCPPQLCRPGVWTNLFHRKDGLGWPLRPRGCLAQVKNVKVSLGGWFRGWTGLSHTLYWTDRSLWEKTIPDLLFPLARKSA